MSVGAEAAPGGVVGGGPYGVPRGHRGGLRAARLRAHADHRVRAVAVRRPVRAGRPTSGGAAGAAGVPRRRPRPRPVRRRHLHPGLRQRPTGGGPRRPQPHPARLRHRLGALVPARVRPHLVDQHQPGHAAEPVRVQGRHRQRQGRGDDGGERLRLGGPGRRPRAGRLDGRGDLPGRPSHPHAHRGLGPDQPPGPGDDHRSQQGGRRSAGPGAGVRRAGLREEGHRRRAGDRRRGAHPTGPQDQPRRGPDPAPWLQLHRRHRRGRPPRRRSVLHRLRPRPRQAVRPDAAGAGRARTSSTSTSSTTARPSSPARPASPRAATGATRSSPERSPRPARPAREGRPGRSSTGRSRSCRRRAAPPAAGRPRCGSPRRRAGR